MAWLKFFLAIANLCIAEYEPMIYVNRKKDVTRRKKRNASENDVLDGVASEKDLVEQEPAELDAESEAFSRHV